MNADLSKTAAAAASAALTPPRTLIIPPQAGNVLHAFGDTVQVKLDGTQTNDSLVVAIGTTPPGGGPPPHIHHGEDEMFLTIEGRFRFFANGEWSNPVEAGGVVYTPRGALHTFQNTGDMPSRHWIITTPSGFEQFFAKCADVFAAATAAGGPPDMGQILSISEEHGLEFVPPIV